MRSHYSFNADSYRCSSWAHEHTPKWTPAFSASRSQRTHQAGMSHPRLPHFSLSIGFVWQVATLHFCFHTAMRKSSVVWGSGSFRGGFWKPERCRNRLVKHLSCLLSNITVSDIFLWHCLSVTDVSLFIFLHCLASCCYLLARTSL